jgi:hypothetical protein
MSTTTPEMTSAGRFSRHAFRFGCGVASFAVDGDRHARDCQIGAANDSAMTATLVEKRVPLSTAPLLSGLPDSRIRHLRNALDFKISRAVYFRSAARSTT